MLVAVGSRNPVKVASVRAAFNAVWPGSEWCVEGCSVASGVSDQPMSDEEARSGARTRAVVARQTANADYGVGLEGGLQQVGPHWFNCGWVYVVDREGIEGMASTVRIVVPPTVMQLIWQGHELGDACDQIFKARNTKQHGGIFGLLSNGAIDRTSAFTDAVVAAVVTFLHPQLMGNI
ncbi:DUF84 family protein [Dactylosporangium sp. CA-139066]|uniref:DUF84 family protein n=1 Tax=Dactylosporangium sp. CA-139066 TaxID=3239930 RepID=UPI003D90FFF3